MTDTPKLMLPVQSAPVDRTLSGSALSGGLGVEASQSTGQVIGSILQTALPALLSLF
jgi:hypothetical protein